MPNIPNNKSNLPTQGLTIYLLKESHSDAEDAIPTKKGIDAYPLESGREHIGDLYVQRRRAQAPRWAKFFKGYLEPGQLGHVSSASAVLLMKARNRLFAITFGQGRYLLDPDGWEERFGLRVALNSIGESNVRSIDKRTFDAISRHTREQASRETAASAFTLDIEQDLLRAITGTPTNSDLGRRMSGMDALHTAIPASITSLRALLPAYFDKFLDTSYRTTFPWVDHISEVSNRAHVDQLDTRLTEQIASGSHDGIWMAVPDVLDWTRVDGFRWSGRQQPLLNDIHLQGFLDSLPDLELLTAKFMKHRKVSCIDHEGIEFASWQAYRCIHAQIDRNGDSYLLSGGKWYKLTRDFVDEVNEAYWRLPRYAHDLPPYADKSETVYNLRAARSDPVRYAHMDDRPVLHGGVYGKVEFCDLLIDGKDILHVKRYGASSVLSHLFSQGLVSGVLFQTDVEFRRKVNVLLPDGHRISDIERRPTTNEYNVVFGVISDKPGDLTLPFFSRLNLKHAVKQLTGYGYRVSIGKIEVEETYRVLKRYDTH